MDITKKLVNFCINLNFDQLPLKVVERTSDFALDFLGVTLKGSQEKSSKVIRQFVKEIDHTDSGGTVIGSTDRFSYQYAALSNGAAGHALELDDVNNEASLHPGVVVFPAALAACEMANKGGKEFIEGVVLGYEVMIRLGKALDPKEQYRKGFHPTGTCGTFGATAAVAKILGLNECQVLDALGIAGSQAAGSMEFLNEGAWTKRIHPGWAAHNGILASLLAKNGYTGPSSIIEGRFGFLHAYSDKSHVEKVVDGIGQDFEILKTSIKPHACCRYMQAPIDAILEIMKKHQIKSNEIKKITLGILQAGFPIIALPNYQKRNPKTVYEAQFSMPYGAAIAVLFGRATIDEFNEDNLRKTEIKDLMEKVYCQTDPSLDKIYPRHWPATAEITVWDGKTFKSRIEYPKGDPENPLTWDELVEKFLSLTQNLYSEEKTVRIIKQIREIQKIENLRSWTSSF